MAKHNYYAIEAGGQKRVFQTWKECEAFRNANPSGARYKGFATEEEAWAFLGAGSSSPAAVTSHSGLEAHTGTAIAYTDGSFNKGKGVWGYGVILFPAGYEQYIREFTDAGTRYSDARNVAGELYGAARAVKEAIRLGFDTIVIFHDYEGVEAWATGRWKAKKELSRSYKNAIAEYSKQIDIQFRKVSGHTGVRFNEAVDGLAKKAAGISD